MIKLILTLLLLAFSACSKDLMKDNECILNWETELFTCNKRSTGRVFYSGEMIFVNEVSYKHGVGKEFYEDGSIYEGSFQYGVRNGMGKYIFPGTAVCSSLWEDDKQSSEVSCEYFEREAGHFRKGNTDGSGNWVGQTVYSFPDGREILELWDNGILISESD